MLCMAMRPDAIMRLGVIQPVGQQGWDPGNEAQLVLNAFASVGSFPVDPSPENMAREALAMAQGMQMGMRFPAWTNPAVMAAAKALANGEAVRITSQGRSVDVQPQRFVINGGR